MTTTAVFPGGSGPNTFIPSFEASGKLQTEFTRAVDSFAYLNYIHIVPVTQTTGYWLQLTAENAARVVNLAESNWARGEPAPKGNWNAESFKFNTYGCGRHIFPYLVESEAQEQAAWDVVAFEGRGAAQQAMTKRTMKAMALLQTSANWGNNTIDVTSITGVVSNWDLSTTARQDIKKSIDYAIEQILLATVGSVSVNDMILLLSPTAARKIASCQEIADYVKGSVHSLPRIMGKEEFKSTGPKMGLPDYLYGLRVIVEDAVKVTSRKGATLASSFVMDSDSALIISRPDGLEGPKNSNSSKKFSTITAFMKEEMTVESNYNKTDRMNEGRVIEDYDHVLTAPASGYMLQNILS